MKMKVTYKGPEAEITFKGTTEEISEILDLISSRERVKMEIEGNDG